MFLEQRKRSWWQLTAADVQEFEQQLRWSRGRQGLLSEHSLAQALGLLRGFLRHHREHCEQDAFAGRLLRHVPRTPPRLLSRPELLQLLSLPDPTEAHGQRDHLLLTLLVFAGLTLQRCRCLSCGEFDLADWPGEVRASAQRYRQSGRLLQQTRPQPHLLLTETGKPYTSDQGLQARLNTLARKLGWRPLPARLLGRAHQEHLAELTRRHAQ